MFGSLARRLTAWYVFVAVLLVVFLAGAVIVAGLLLYARDVNDQIGAFARQVPDIEARALSDGDHWDAARKLLLRRLGRPGLTVRAIQPPATIRRSAASGEYGYFRYPAGRPGPGLAVPQPPARPDSRPPALFAPR